MPDTKTLYDKDFLAWSKVQAEALRAEARTGSNQKLDWANLAEEIESLGVSQKRELRSSVQRIIRYLPKLEYSPAREPRRLWDESIGDARSEIELLLNDSPSLAADVQSVINDELGRGSRKAICDLEKYGELTPVALAGIRATTYTVDQIVGDWFPPEPQP
jgi:hypothetical protein